jgi:hypothetical protein
MSMFYERGCKCPDACAYHPTPNRPFYSPDQSLRILVNDAMARDSRTVTVPTMQLDSILFQLKLTKP